jgi:hypothetical protein
VNIELRIERLLLEGVPVEPHLGHTMQRAIEVELTRLLAEQGLSPELARGAALDRLSGHSMELGGDMSPAHVGARIAGAVHANLTRPRPGRGGATP